jgi:AraC-like DNA-binding protein
MTTCNLTTFRFSTANIPPERRIPTWQAVYGSPIARRILSPSRVSNRFFHVEMKGHMLGGSESSSPGGTSLMRMTVSMGGMARRTAELLSDGDDDVVLHIQEAGRRIVTQLGREATVNAGGGLLTSNADASTIVMPGAARFTSIAVPRRIMSALVPGLEDALMRSLPPDTDVLRLLVKYMHVLDDEEALRTPELRHAVAVHIHDLCALAIGATRDNAEMAHGRGLRAARLRAIKADVVQNLGNRDVSASALALRQRVTPRYVHKLFEREGTTLSRFVLNRRLAQVHRMLSDCRYGHLTIGALAYEVGFGDLSTFNREFRRHFGVTPSDVRAAMRQ